MFAAYTISSRYSFAPATVGFLRLMLAHKFSHLIFSQSIFARDGLEGDCVTPSHQNNLLNINRGKIFHMSGIVPEVHYLRRASDDIFGILRLGNSAG